MSELTKKKKNYFSKKKKKSGTTAKISKKWFSDVFLQYQLPEPKRFPFLLRDIFYGIKNGNPEQMHYS